MQSPCYEVGKISHFKTFNVRMKSLISPVKLRVGRETNTIEEKIQNLQQQIDWLKENLSGEMKVIYKKILIHKQNCEL